MTFQALTDYSMYIPYCTVQYFILFYKFYISLNESLSPDAYSCKCVFKDKRLHDHVFSFGYFLRSTTFIVEKQWQSALALNRPIRKIYGLFWIQYGKILDGHVVQIKDAHWMNLLDVE